MTYNGVTLRTKMSYAESDNSLSQNYYRKAKHDLCKNLLRNNNTCHCLTINRYDSIMFMVSYYHLLSIFFIIIIIVIIIIISSSSSSISISISISIILPLHPFRGLGLTLRLVDRLPVV